MGAAQTTLKFLLIADSARAEKGISRVGGEAEKTGGRLHKMGTVSKVAILGVGAAAVGFANSSISKFRQVTSESRGLERALGGTLQEASRWREAAILSGVDAGTFTKSMQKLDKGLIGAAGSTKAAAAMTATLGFKFTDAHGKVKPMNDLLPKIADKFATLPDGADKTALAMKLFGKAGNAMLPFLSKGSAGIAELKAQSDKFGTTLSNGAIDALAKSNESSRQWTAAMDGLKVQIGAQLMPIMTTLVGFIRDHVIPIVQAITGFVKEHKDAVMFAVVVIGTLVVGIKAWSIAQAALNTIMALNPFGLVVIAIAALAAGLIYAYKKSDTFRAIVKEAFHVVAVAGKFLWNDVLKPVFTAIRLSWKLTADLFLFAYNNIIHPMFTGFKTYIGIWWGTTKAIFSAIGTAWHAVGTALHWVWTTIVKPVFGYIKAGIRGARDVIKTVIHAISAAWKGIGAGLQWAWDHTIGPIIDAINGGIQHTLDLLHTIEGNPNGITSQGGTLTIAPPDGNGKGAKPAPPKKLAVGGVVTRATHVIAGEAGPEAIIPLSGASRYGIGKGGHSTNIYVTVHGVVGDGKTVAREVLANLQRLKADGVNTGLA